MLSDIKSGCSASSVSKRCWNRGSSKLAKHGSTRSFSLGPFFLRRQRIKHSTGRCSGRHDSPGAWRGGVTDLPRLVATAMCAKRDGQAMRSGSAGTGKGTSSAHIVSSLLCARGNTTGVTGAATVLPPVTTVFRGDRETGDVLLGSGRASSTFKCRPRDAPGTSGRACLGDVTLVAFSTGAISGHSCDLVLVFASGSGTCSSQPRSLPRRGVPKHKVSEPEERS
mmetsp:Transcript_35213/g.71888  ORF Transcript_35213/g.71888 Transcript_35213/m.71888 type:complete len:224 (-) Transcript_35213:118-789(-)